MGKRKVCFALRYEVKAYDVSNYCQKLTVGTEMCIWLTDFIPILPYFDRIWKRTVAQRPISAQRLVIVLWSKINPNRNKVQSQIKVVEPRAEA